MTRVIHTNLTTETVIRLLRMTCMNELNLKRNHQGGILQTNGCLRKKESFLETQLAIHLATKYTGMIEEEMWKSMKAQDQNGDVCPMASHLLLHRRPHLLLER